MPRFVVDYAGAVAFARSREGSVRATLTLNRLSGKAPRDLARFLGIPGTAQKEVSSYAQAVFDELIDLGVMERAGGRFYLAGHKPSDRQKASQPTEKPMPGIQVTQDPALIDPRIAKRQAEFRLRRLRWAAEKEERQLRGGGAHA